MKTEPFPAIRARAVALLCLLLLLFFACFTTGCATAVLAQEPSPAERVKAAWALAQSARQYEYSSQIRYEEEPQPMLANIGRQGSTAQLYLEGSVAPQRGEMHLALWQQGDALTQAEDALEIRITAQGVEGRVGGAAWQPLDGVADDEALSFKLLGDPLELLAAADELRFAAAETRLLPTGASVRYTRYRFNVDGPALEQYMRRQLEAAMRQRGELAGGMQLAPLDYYARATGSGEIWLDADGYPLKLEMSFIFPPESAAPMATAPRFAVSEAVAAQLAAPASMANHLQITTHFSGFTPEHVTQEGAGAAWRSLAAGLFESVGQGLAQVWPALLIATGMLGLSLYVLWPRRSRARQVGVNVLLMMALVLTPLLTSFEYARADERLSQRIAASEAQPDQLAVPAEAAAWNPHVAPEWQTEATAVSTNLLQSNPTVGRQAPADDGADSDGDGLTDIEERQLGTDPNAADTDSDGITDRAEITGFAYRAQQWYSDPTSPDTNGDGRLDGVECPQRRRASPTQLSDATAVCADTDGDGTPDLFDRDDDGDGVPDSIDLSAAVSFPQPTSGAAQTYSAARPLTLQLDALAADKITLVDLQLRPTDDARLYYANNVLDWPAGDHQGQIQRKPTTDGSPASTFASYSYVDPDTQQVVTVSDAGLPQNANGDMRIVPMLRVTLPYEVGHFYNLPRKAGAAAPERDTAVDTWADTDLMSAYGVTVRKLDDQGTLALYAPIHLTMDPGTGNRAAFATRIPYQGDPSGSWGRSHAVELIWAVQMLTDFCLPTADDYTPPAAVDRDNATAVRDAWCENPRNWQSEPPRIVQVYTDGEWLLSGLNASEESGTDLAVIYQPDQSRAGDLWFLAQSLQYTFLTGRDSDRDGQRDLTVTEIADRFRAGSTASATARWGIPAEFEVDTYAFATGDEAVALNDGQIAQALGQFETGEQPTLLFAKESRTRTVNANRGTAVSQQGSSLVLSLTGIETSVTAELRWVPYKYTNGAWDVAPLHEYITGYLDPLLYAAFGGSADSCAKGAGTEPDAEAEACGYQTLARSHYVALFGGLSQLVQSGTTILVATAAQDDAALSAIWDDYGSTLSDAIVAVTERVAEELLTSISNTLSEAQEFADALGVPNLTSFSSAKNLAKVLGKTIKGLKGSIAGFFKQLAQTTKGKVGLTVGVVGIAAAVVVIGLSAGGVLDARAAVIAVGAVKAATAVVSSVMTFIKTARQGISSFEGGVSKAGVVGAIVSGIVAWGAFIAQVAIAGTPVFSLAFDSALAGVIAQTVTIAIMVAIASIPIIGQIIAAVVALIDGIIALACGAAGVGSSSPPGVQWVCKGISGIITALVQWFIYSGDDMINLDSGDRVVWTGPHSSFAHPEQGMSASAAQPQNLGYSMVITNSIQLKLPWERGDDIPDWKASAFAWQYDRNALYASVFDYALGTEKQTLHQDLFPYSMADQWQAGPPRTLPYCGIYDDDSGVGRWCHTAFSATAVSTDGKVLTIDRPGINVDTTLYLSEGHNVRAQECWAIVFIPVCYLRADANTQHYEIGPTYDVFPPTLEAFYALSNPFILVPTIVPTTVPPFFELVPEPLFTSDDRYVQSWDVGFPVLPDADGDGLHFEVDPDDTRWDADGDGLSDWYEHQNGSDSRQPDSDGDGLDDYEEMAGGTSPTQADTDGDGLADPVEIAGWAYTYETFDGRQATTWVRSDPLTIDTDGDGLSDAVEKDLGTHPRVALGTVTIDFTSALSAGSDQRPLQSASYIAPRERIYYTTTISSLLPGFTISGTLSTVLQQQALVSSSDRELMLPPFGRQVLTGLLDVPGSASSGTIALVQHVDAGITPTNSAVPVDVLQRGSDSSAAPQANETRRISESHVHHLIIDADPPTVGTLNNVRYRSVADATLGFSAGDSASGVASVEWQVSDGPWQAAAPCLDAPGTWCAAWTPPTQGRFDVRARAIDNVGNVSEPSAAYETLVDGTAPQVTTDLNSGSFVIPRQKPDATPGWVITLAGTVTDPTLPTGQPGSGLNSFELALERSDGSLVGRSQPVLVDGSRWEADFTLDEVDPTGVYTLRAWTADLTGNRQERAAVAQLRIDTEPPTVALDLPIVGAADYITTTQTTTGEVTISTTSQITASVTLRGALGDRGGSGVADVAVAFRPIVPVSTRYNDAAPGRPSTWVDFEDAGRVYEDTTFANLARTDADAAPARAHFLAGAGVARDRSVHGTIGAFGLRLLPYDVLTVPDVLGAGTAVSGLTLAAWLNVAPSAETEGAPVLALQSAAGVDRMRVGYDPQSDQFYVEVRFDDGLRRVDLEPLGARAPVNTGQWNHVVLAAAADGKGTLYINGEGQVRFSDVPLPQPGDRLQLTNPQGDSSVDDVRLYPRAISVSEIAALANERWHVGTVDAGNGRWQLAIPQDLEGYYRVSLRARDNAGNQTVIADAWNGFIDTQAPRLTFDTQTVGGATDVAIQVEDFSLSSRGFSTPCGAGVIDTMTTYQAPWYEEFHQGIDLNRTYRFSVGCTLTSTTTLQEFSSFQIAGNSISGLAVDSDRIYTANGELGVQILSLASDGHLSSLGRFDTPGNASDVAASGSYLYVADGWYGLRVFDVSNPATAVPVAAYDPGAWPSDVRVDRVIVRDNRAYALESRLSYFLGIFPTYTNVIQVFDISTPGRLALLGGLSLPGLYLTGLFIDGNQAYVSAGNNGLFIVDIGNDRDLRLLAATSYGGADARGVTRLGDYVYVADGERGLRILNVQNPVQPRLTATLPLSGTSYDVVARRDSAVGSGEVINVFVAHSTGLLRVDATVPAAPTLQDNMDTADSVYRIRLEDSHAVEAVEDLLFLANLSGGVRAVQADLAELQVRACDAYGNCVLEDVTLPAGAAPQAAPAGEPDAASAAAGLRLDFGPVPLTLDSTAPFTLTGFMAADAGFQTLELLANDVVFDTQDWSTADIASGVALTETIWLGGWTPGGDGRYNLSAKLTDRLGETTTRTLAAPVLVDSTPPAVSLTTQVITRTHLSQAGIVTLAGTLSDSGGVVDLQVTLDGQPLQTHRGPDAQAGGETWTAVWPAGATSMVEADLPLSVVAADVAGHTTRLEQSVAVDLVPPPPVPLSLALGETPLSPGQIVRTMDPVPGAAAELRLSWPARASTLLPPDEVLWQIWDTGGNLRSERTTLAPGTTSASLFLEHPALVTATLTQRDALGNVRENAWGAVTVDGPRTPDLMRMSGADGSGAALSAAAIVGNSCSDLGSDRRVAEKSTQMTGGEVAQQLFVAWDDDGLGLVWEGANWNSDGDLFIYLDSAAGGSEILYDPYAGPDEARYLPGVQAQGINEQLSRRTTRLPGAINAPLAADFVVWVQDSETVQLLAWQAGSWQPVANVPGLQYAFDPHAGYGQTALYLPFALLGISTPSQQNLALLAFASEERALSIWATLPVTNPLNSPRVIDTAVYAKDDAAPFALTRAYTWSSLGPDVCPSGADGGQTRSLQSAAHVDLDINITADPRGTAYAFLGDDLFYHWHDLFEGSTDVGTLLSHLDTRHLPVGTGQTVRYTLTITNRGDQRVGDLVARLQASGLTLQGSSQRAVPGIAPRETVQLPIEAQVTDGDASRVTLQVSLQQRQDTLEWLWVDHMVDRTPPVFFGLLRNEVSLHQDGFALQGYAYDDSGVSRLEVEVERPDGAVSRETCAVERPFDGRWACVVDGGGGDTAVTPDYRIRLRATDGLGLTSAWSGWQPLRVDQFAPDVTLDQAPTVVSGTLRLSGTVQNVHASDDLSVCVGGACTPVALPAVHAPGHSYDHVPSFEATISDSGACDASGVVAFSVGDDFTLSEVLLGLAVEHPQRGDLQISLIAPSGRQVVLLAAGATQGQGLDVLFRDAAAGALSNLDHTVGGHSGPALQHEVRPQTPLSVYVGESARGTWRLQICDLVANGMQGRYVSARLQLVPLERPVVDGVWQAEVPLPTVDDRVLPAQILASDAAGNRAAVASWLMTVDTVPPQLSVTESTALLNLDLPLAEIEAQTVLRGTVSDGGGVANLYASIETPAGQVYQRGIEPAGNVWQLDWRPTTAGRHQIWVTAVDEIGNYTSVGPLPVMVTAPGSRYGETNWLPMIIGRMP